MGVDKEEGFKAAYTEPANVSIGLVAPMISFKMHEIVLTHKANYDGSEGDAGYVVSAAPFRFFQRQTAVRAGIQRCLPTPRDSSGQRAKKASAQKRSGSPSQH